MTDGRGSARACQSRSVAVVSKMPKRIWQLNYKRTSTKFYVSILRRARGELPEPDGTTFLREAKCEPIGLELGASPSEGSGRSVMASRDDNLAELLSKTASIPMI